MRILVAHCVSRARKGGMSRLMGFIHDQLLADRTTVDYFCAEEMSPRVGRILARLVFPLLVVRFAWRAARAGKPYDIINVHEMVSWAPVLLRRFIGRPRVVVMVYGLEQRLYEMEREESRLGRRRLSCRNRIVRPITILWPAHYALKHADHVFTQNEEDKEYLTQRLGLPAARITRVHTGANAIFGERSAHRDYERGDRLIFAGTWEFRKGVREVIEAFERIASYHPSATLTVSGSGISSEEVKAGFSEGARLRVRVLPSLTEEEAAEEFARGDIYLLPSLFEGTPLTLIEAMRSGLPIVTTRASGMKDVIRHGQNGLLIDMRSPAMLAEALETLMGDRQLREKLGRAACADAQTLYTWASVAKPVRQAYHGLFSRKR